MIDNNTIVVHDAEKMANLKTIGLVSYILHFIVAVGAVIPGFQPGIALLLVAFLIDIVKKSDANGTWQESHFSWRIRTVIWAGILYVITIPLYFPLWFPGWIAWGIISLWFLYRVVRGLMAHSDNKPMPM